jgi:hypothetical protein
VTHVFPFDQDVDHVHRTDTVLLRDQVEFHLPTVKISYQVMNGIYRNDSEFGGILIGKE